MTREYIGVDLHKRFFQACAMSATGDLIVLTAAGLRRILTEYIAYYERSRTHLGLNKDAPISRPVTPPTAGPAVGIPQVGGLHHRYERQAA